MYVSICFEFDKFFVVVLFEFLTSFADVKKKNGEKRRSDEQY